MLYENFHDLHIEKIHKYSLAQQWGNLEKNNRENSRWGELSFAKFPEQTLHFFSVKVFFSIRFPSYSFPRDI